MRDAKSSTAKAIASVALGLTVAGSFRATVAAPAADGPKVFLGYLYGDAKNIRFELYTHICHAFAVAGEDGRIRPDRRVPSRELTRRAHAAGVQVLLSLGGWGWDQQFAKIVADPAAEDRYVAAALAIVEEFDYDGIDLDWEYPDAEQEIPGFERLVRRLRAGVDAIGAKRGRPLLVTMAVAANPGTLSWLNTDFLLESFDWMNVMTYDYAGRQSRQARHNAPLFASSKLPAGAPSIERTIRYLLDERKLPPQRLLLGLPLYGRGFAVSEPYAATAGAPRPRHGSARYAQVVSLLNDGWQRRWDDETKTPWLIAPDGKEVIGFDDVESLALKTRWAMDQGLRGVFFWEIKQDRLADGANPLQQAARAAWAAARSTQLP
jgi:chitinase